MDVAVVQLILNQVQWSKSETTVQYSRPFSTKFHLGWPWVRCLESRKVSAVSKQMLGLPLDGRQIFDQFCPKGQLEG